MQGLHPLAGVQTANRGKGYIVPNLQDPFCQGLVDYDITIRILSGILSSFRYEIKLDGVSVHF